ncbi:hypothetical protein EVAR_99860_1 [Eumeta japonica]|uniref:Uncharacterized protein n=1 Tax=Eumeta variegata TaxID=151549 RepID=A0A4C1ZJP2_EUMVA|nr:hypothetical protein EVAR_99860_1 [Eumeta japonica]
MAPLSGSATGPAAADCQVIGRSKRQEFKARRSSVSCELLTVTKIGMVMESRTNVFTRSPQEEFGYRHSKPVWFPTNISTEA